MQDPLYQSNLFPPEEMGFQRAVETMIGERLKPLGFRCTLKSPRDVRYESDRVGVRLDFEPITHCVNTYIYPLDGTGRKFYLGDVVELSAGPGAPASDGFHGFTKARLQFAIVRIAEMLLKYGPFVFDGQPDKFDTMEASVRKRDEEYNKEIVNHPFHVQAEEAWGKRDYHRVLELYQSIESDLTVVEAARRKYIRGKMA